MPAYVKIAGFGFFFLRFIVVEYIARETSPSEQYILLLSKAVQLLNKAVQGTILLDLIRTFPCRPTELHELHE